MSQPQPYNPSTTFVSFQAQQPWFPGQQLDAEFNNLATSVDEIETNLALIQRDDGELLNQSVGYDQLDPVLAAALGDLPNIAAVTALANEAVASAAAALVSQNAAFASAAAALVSQNSASTSATSATASAATATTEAGIATTQAAAALASATAAAATEAALIAGLAATSTTSLPVGTGAQTFTTQSGKLYTAGQFLLVSSAANSANYMHGTVTSYSGTSLVMNITDVGGSGTHADWNINLSGTQGPAGTGTISGLTLNQVPIAGGASSITASVPLTSGQLLVGAASGAPAAQTMSGDATLAAGGALTLAGVITAGGPTGSTSIVPVITYDAKGRLTAVSIATVTPAAIGAAALAGNQTITGGYLITPFSVGSPTNGSTYTPAAANGNYQYLTNNVSGFTIAVPAADSAIDVLITNGASAGTITFSGYTVGTTGDALDTTSGHKFLLSIRRINSVSFYMIKALQ